jgi:Rrf2 family nitric oxide-sensitive transcriptional repressor
MYVKGIFFEAVDDTYLQDVHTLSGAGRAAMQLTKHTDYALRVLLYIAQKPERSTIGEIAQAYEISGSHLMKVVNQLVRHGFVDAVRGKGGGIKLARAPELVNVGEVVRCTEETLDVLDCLSRDYRGGCCLAPACGLKSVLREAQHVFFRHLDAYTLHDLLPDAPRRIAVHMPGRDTAPLPVAS